MMARDATQSRGLLGHVRSLFGNRSAERVHVAPPRRTKPPLTLEDGATFRELRERAGLSQARAAKLCDVDPSTVYRWEKGIQAHTHSKKNSRIHEGIDLMRWAAEQKEVTGKPVSIEAMILEAARRVKTAAA